MQSSPTACPSLLRKHRQTGISAAVRPARLLIRAEHGRRLSHAVEAILDEGAGRRGATGKGVPESRNLAGGQIVQNDLRMRVSNALIAAAEGACTARQVGMPGSIFMRASETIYTFVKLYFLFIIAARRIEKSARKRRDDSDDGAERKQPVVPN